VDFSSDKVVSQIISRLQAARVADGPVKVDGTWGSFAPMFAAHISKTLKRPILYVSPHIDDADQVSDDLQVFAAKVPQTFPVWEDTEQLADATDEIGTERIRIALNLSQPADKRDFSELIISTCVQALNQPVIRPELLRAGGLELRVNHTIEPELVVTWLVDNGFERVDSIDMPGQFARRGGIIDIFSPVSIPMDLPDSLSTGSEPVRIEFFADTIESIRRIDLDSQLSSRQIDNVCIIAPPGQQMPSQTELFINLLDPETIIILAEPTQAQEVSEVFLSRVEEPDRLYPWEAIYKSIRRFTCLEISRFAPGPKSEYISLDVTSAQQFEHKAGSMWTSSKATLDELVKLAEKKEIILYCENSAEIQRVGEIISQSHKKLPDNFHLRLGFIQQGFIINSLNTIVLSHHEIFGQYAIRRRIRRIRGVSAIESLLDLQKGDYVVHVSYGIGKFLGIKTITKDGGTVEYLTIEYAKKTLIHVPVSNIALVQKYIGSLPKRPPLSTIGTKKWEKQKQRVAEGVTELASRLLEVQAERESLGGFAFTAVSTWQKEFEESFLYQETGDQLKVAEQIKTDMTRPVAMERLLCGDVGYGKTELAMRAAFKAVEAGRQVAVLVPTTVLCIQHSRTFAERFADFPIIIKMLNRFVSAKKAGKITAGLKDGKVDIIIGTHRLLSKDIGFKDLGLLIIDEEQRFGVEHKEKLKRFRVNVDVLTMTATPIPRTLHLSLLGLRDISSLTTPPLDRRSIVTKVCSFDKKLIRRAILNELNRQGQVFFVHNRVQSIERMADDIRKIVNDPNITIDIAHGQMARHELENAMIKFVIGQTDVLVCSTIIESGLDIPNANTMIINDADRFGLAQLHQLRGRVGRYKYRAYAYMLLPATRSITPIAARRLKAIEEYSQLGAGFRIALRDLQIRGAGNILGSEQSGHINTVGYEMYCRLLSETVKRLRNEPTEEIPATLIDLGFSTYIPKSYISSDRQRMDVYRKIATAKHIKDLTRLRDELADLYGSLPQQVEMLLDLSELRIMAWQWKIKSIMVSLPDVVFSFENIKEPKALFAGAPGVIRIPDAKTAYLRLQKSYLEPMTLMAVLRKILSVKTFDAV